MSAPCVTPDAIVQWKALRAHIIERCGARMRIIDERVDGMAFRLDELRIIVSVARELDGNVWAHVSASLATALPGWVIMKRLKRDVLGEEACAVLVMPPASKHVDIHTFVHHLWGRLDGPTVPDFTHGTGSI